MGSAALTIFFEYDVEDALRTLVLAGEVFIAVTYAATVCQALQSSEVAQPGQQSLMRPLRAGFRLSCPRNRIPNKRISGHSQACFVLHDFTPHMHDLTHRGPARCLTRLGCPAVLSDTTVKDSLHDQLATGVQRWCCHDCELNGLVTGLFVVN